MMPFAAMRLRGAAQQDPLFASVKSLLHFDGANGSTTFTDQIGARTWTRTGASLVISTAQFKFGGSALFTGAINGNYLTSDSTADFGFGTGDFTIEFWHRTPSSFGSFHFIADWRDAGNQAKPCIFVNGTALVYYVSGATRITGSVTLATSTWYHMAISRVSGTTRMFINGALAGTWTDATNYVTARCALNSAGDTLGTFGCAGYIDDFRVTKGAGRYVAAFTPPSAPFPNS